MGVIMRGGVPYGNFDRNNLEIITTPLEEVEDKKEDLIYVVKDNIDAAEGEAWCWDGEKAIRIGKAGGGSIELDIDEDMIPLGDGEGNLKNSGVKYFNYIETKTIPGQSATGFPYYFPNETSFYIQDSIAFFNGNGGTANVIEKYTIDEEAHDFDISITQNNNIFTATVNNKTVQIPMSELSSTEKTYTYPDSECEVGVTAKEEDYEGTMYYYTLFTFKLFNFEIDAENPPAVLEGKITKAVASFNSSNPYSHNTYSYIKSNESPRSSGSLTSIKYKKSGATISTSSKEFKSSVATPSREEVIADDNMLQVPGDKPFRLKIGENTGAELILKDNMQTVIGGSGVISVKDKCYVNIHNDGRTSISNASDLRQNTKGGIYPNNTADCAIINILGMPAIMIQDQAAMKIEQDTQILCGGSSIVTMRHNANLNMEGNAYINMQTNYSGSDYGHDQSIHKSPYFAMSGGCSLIMQGDRNHNADETGFPAIICEKDRFLFDSRISNGTGNKSGNSFYGPQIGSAKYTGDNSERTYMSVEGNTFVRIGASSDGASYPGKTILTIGGKASYGTGNPTTEIYIEGNTFTKISGEAHIEFQDKSKFYNLDESIFVMRNSSTRSGMDLTSTTSPKFEMIGKCSIETTSDGITINGVNFTNSQLEALKALL